MSVDGRPPPVALGLVHRKHRLTASTDGLKGAVAGHRKEDGASNGRCTAFGRVGMKPA
jgi:hypothetical protein